MCNLLIKIGRDSTIKKGKRRQWNAGGGGGDDAQLGRMRQQQRGGFCLNRWTGFSSLHASTTACLCGAALSVINKDEIFPHHPPGASILTTRLQGNYKDVWQATIRGMLAEMAVAAQNADAAGKIGTII